MSIEDGKQVQGQFLALVLGDIVEPDLDPVLILVLSLTLDGIDAEELD